MDRIEEYMSAAGRHMRHAANYFRTGNEEAAHSHLDDAEVLLEQLVSWLELRNNLRR